METEQRLNRVRDEMEWGCLCWPFGEWTVAFAAPHLSLSPLWPLWGRLHPDKSRQAIGYLRQILDFRGRYLCQSP